MEELLLPYSDKATTIAGTRPTLYVQVPAHIINAVVSKHAGIHSGRLPELADVDEDGVLWAAAAYVPSTTSEESEEEALTSVVHLDLPPPPPPPLPPTPITTPTQTPTTGHLSPPTPLLNMTLSPIERTQEDF